MTLSAPSILSAETLARFMPPEGRFREHMERLSDEPHVAGSEANSSIAAYIGRCMSSYGFSVEYSPYDVLLCRPVPDESFVEIVSPVSMRLKDKEEPSGRHGSRFAECLPGFNAFSANGDAVAPIVFVNYGRKEDFAYLSDSGIELRGRVAVARYGKLFRGKIAANAQAAGAVGVLFYGDPAEYDAPKGHGMKSCAIQRGGILNLPYPGDPLTPGAPALPTDGDRSAIRLDESEVAFPRIMAAPISWESASEILSRADGRVAPEGWQGGLPFTYHLGDGGSVRVRLAVRQDRCLERITNVIGSLAGEARPDEQIIIGSHYDAWAFGSADPISGTAMLLVASEALGNMRKAGLRFSRTIRVAHWDAEEQGTMGSVEWLEEYGRRCEGKTIAYFNADGVATGPNLEMKGAPLLRGVMREIAKAVPYEGGLSFFEKWKSQETGAEFQPMGGGSDHVGFQFRHAVPSCLTALTSPTPVYHSLLDNLDWYEEFGDPSFSQGGRLARYLVCLLFALSESPVIPYSVGELIDYIDESAKALDLRESSRAILSPAISEARKAAEALSSPIDVPCESAAEIDRLLLAIEGLFQGDGSRWAKSLLYSVDPDSGYGELALPTVALAIKAEDVEAECREVSVLAESVRLLASRLGEIRRILERKTRGGRRASCYNQSSRWANPSDPERCSGRELKRNGARVNPTSLKDKIRDQILEGIVSGQFPLDVFLKEGDLAQRYGVSRAPVREALVQLCNEQIIKNIPRAGYQIIHLTAKDYSNAVQLRLILETEGAKLALPRIAEPELRKIHETILETHYPSDQKLTVRDWWEGNKRFHLLLCSYSGNTLLFETLDRILSILLRATMQVFSDEDPSRYLRFDEDNHYLIEKAIQDKDEAELVSCLAKDIVAIPRSFPWGEPTV